MVCLLFRTIAVLLLVESIRGHGMMMDPVNRASLWRFDPISPPDYEDNQSFCGGQTVQWNVNQGKCGFCGDDFRDALPRPHENGGKYGEGKIVANYTRGGVLPVTILLTANHRGMFHFSVCALASGKDLETDSCFRNLTLVDGDEIYKVPNPTPGEFKMQLQLPADLTCEQCVLRWHYRAGNTWGNCEDGHGAEGCGPQETFRSCSDISIY